MRSILLTAFALVCLLSASARAGPEGIFAVEGTSPGGGQTYTGTVSVKRNGQVYEVVWQVGGERFVGTGLGAAWIKGALVMGPAAAKDVALSISFASSGNYGLVFMNEQPSGQWQGIWTFGGATAVGTEVWTPR